MHLLPRSMPWLLLVAFGILLLCSSTLSAADQARDDVKGVQRISTSRPAPMHNAIPTVRDNGVSEDFSRSFRAPSAEAKTPTGLPAGITSHRDSKVIYNNGPLVNYPDSGAGGADVSAVQNDSLGMSTFGLNHSFAGGLRVADDFEVTNPGGWRIDSVVTFCYQTNGPIASSINLLNFQIWDGPPDNPSSSIIFGDTTSNRLGTTAWSGIYRATQSTLSNTARPIMRNVGYADGWMIGPGTYWLVWSTDGNISSGPWATPITINGDTITGNALQRVSAGWQPIEDSGLDTLGFQGLPFLILGDFMADPNDTLGLLHYNGPLVNGIGSGVGGGNESILPSLTPSNSANPGNLLGFSTLGFGHQVTAGNRMADDFTFDDNVSIDAFAFFAYQTAANKDTTTMTAVNYRIWDGVPGDPSSTVLFGDTLTNTLLTSEWSGAYRVSQTTTGTANNRPIMKNLCVGGMTLPAGTYWVDWQTDGSLASGPWQPPISVFGQGNTGNSLQFTGTWTPASDGTDASDTIAVQDMPFMIYGSVLTDVREPGRLPVSFELRQNYPNPFNPSTTITYTLPSAMNVEIAVYNMLGQRVGEVINGYNTAGTHHAIFSGDNLSTGVYYYAIRAGSFTASRKMMLLK
jgi:Secretion system C-terminal sorting domain